MMTDQTTTDAATMTVNVRDRSSEAPWGSGLTNPVIRTVTISTRCPQCGGPRGVPRNLNQHDDGVWYSSDVWDNPCGHVDSYAAVVREARAVECPGVSEYGHGLTAVTVHVGCCSGGPAVTRWTEATS